MDNNAKSEKDKKIFDEDDDSIIKNRQITIKRKLYLQEDLNVEQAYDRSKQTILYHVKKKVQRSSCKNFILDLIPILRWLPKYNVKEDLVSDILSGFTVAIMNIPQGMAYALLGNVPPIYGIYMAFFPIIIYSLLGTSRHVSMGGMAIPCLMTGNIVTQILAKYPEAGYDNTLIAGTVSFCVGIIFVSMFLIRVGIVADLLSEPLISSFTCASAFHIITTQIKDLFGLRNVKKISGTFKFPRTVYELCLSLPTINWATVSVSSMSIFFLVTNNYLLKPWLAKRTKVPFPAELFVVVSGTLANYLLNLSDEYNVENVGTIATGFPPVRLPIMEIIPEIIYDTFFIALVSYTITMSMALFFASKRNYEVRPNQELLAMGCSDITGSFFGCLPITASLSRSLIQFDVGGKTQLTSLISCTLLVFVLLWIGSLFSLLPKAILACIIVVALKNMLIKVMETKKFYRLNKWDFTVWMFTFLSTLIFNIDVGLFVGFLFSLISIFVRGFKPYTCLLGSVPGTDLYLDMKKYKSVVEVPGVHIFRYCGGLNFATKATFKDLLWKSIGFDPLREQKKKLRQNGKETGEVLMSKCVVVDFSALTFVDPQGVNVLSEIKKALEVVGVKLYIASCSVPVYEVIQKVSSYYERKKEFLIFPTIHDAVLFAQSSNTNEVNDRSEKHKNNYTEIV